MNGSKRNLYNIIYMIRVREHFIYIYIYIYILVRKSKECVFLNKLCINYDISYIYDNYIKNFLLHIRYDNYILRNI